MEKYLIFTDIKRAFEMNMESIFKRVDSFHSFKKKEEEGRLAAILLQEKLQREQEQKKLEMIEAKRKLDEQKAALLEAAKKAMGYG